MAGKKRGKERGSEGEGENAEREGGKGGGDMESVTRNGYMYLQSCSF